MEKSTEIEKTYKLNYRTEHISRLFQKMSKKRLEAYVVSRIWHTLNDEEIKIVPQQFVENELGKYALTNLFLPQFDLHIEVNEPAHYATEEKQYRDAIRKKEIERNSKHHVIEIDCRGTLFEANFQVDECISSIRNAIEIQIKENRFRPWQTESEFTVDFHKINLHLKLNIKPNNKSQLLGFYFP